MTSKLDADATDALMGLKKSPKPGETNADADATDATIGLNGNAQEQGKTNKNEVHNDQRATAIATLHI